MIEYWAVFNEKWPPEADAEFVAHMEEVLETYGKVYDSASTVLCMDEQPVQLLKETRTPIKATQEHGKRVDYEYERNGTASIFMFAEPLAGFRQATAVMHQRQWDFPEVRIGGLPPPEDRDRNERATQTTPVEFFRKDANRSRRLGAERRNFGTLSPRGHPANAVLPVEEPACFQCRVGVWRQEKSESEAARTGASRASPPA